MNKWKVIRMKLTMFIIHTHIASNKKKTKALFKLAVPFDKISELIFFA